MRLNYLVFGVLVGIGLSWMIDNLPALVFTGWFLGKILATNS